MKYPVWFNGITARKKIILLLRSCTFILILVWIILILVGLSKDTARIYIHKLEFSHLNVAKGLYNALANNANSQANTDVPYGPGFTTSEIQILVDYTSEEFRDSPQFLVSSIWDYCYGTFDSVNLSNDNLDKHFEDGEHKRIRISKCLSPENYYFNYRSLLGQIGLTIILEYAYDGDFSSNARYSKLMQSVFKVMKIFPNSLFFVIVAQSIMFLVSFVIYGLMFKQNGKKNQLAVFLEHFNALLSSACLIAVMVAVMSLVIISFELKSRVASELGDFGIKMHLGRIFFSLIWVLFVTSFLNFCVWGGVAWCTVPEEDPDNDDRFYRANFRKSMASLSAYTNSANSPHFLNSQSTSYEDELKKDMTFVTRSNTGYASTFYSATRSSSRKYKPNRSRAGSQGTTKFLASAGPTFTNDVNQSQNEPKIHGNNMGSTPSTATIYPENQNMFLSIGKNKQAGNENRKSQSNTDLVSMVSENDMYANDVNYNQILQPMQTSFNYSGFGLRKNGTIKNNVTFSKPAGNERGNNNQRDIEQEFFTVQQYGYDHNGNHHQQYGYDYNGNHNQQYPYNQNANSNHGS